MTGPEHWTTAEEILELAGDPRQEWAPGALELALRHAQVHAQLANAAATIEVALAHRAGEQGGTTRSLADWQDAMRPPQ